MGNWSEATSLLIAAQYKSPAGLARCIDFGSDCATRDLQEKGPCHWRGAAGTCGAGGGEPNWKVAWSQAGDVLGFPCGPVCPGGLSHCY